MPGSYRQDAVTPALRLSQTIWRGTPPKLANAPDPIRQRLCPARLGVGEVRRAEGRDKDLCSPYLSGRTVDQLHRLPGIIDEHPLAGRMGLAHRRRQAPAPRGIELAEPTVAISFRLPSSILLPNQQQGDVRPTQLGMHPRPVRLRPRRLARREGRAEQLAFQRRIVQLSRYRPGEAHHAGAAQILSNRVAADTDHRRDLVPAMAAHVFEAKNFSNLTHRQSLTWHGALPG